MSELQTLPRPEPRAEGLAGEFFAHAREGRLCFQRCGACGAWRHLPRLQCPACGSTDWAWQPSCGRGRILSWTVTHQPSHPAFAAPFAVIVVELEEGVRMVSGLRELPPASLELDLPVEVVFERISQNVTLPYFRPAQARPGPGPG